MKTCIVTKLKGAVVDVDNSLLKIGETRLKTTSIQSAGEHNENAVKFTKEVTLNIINGVGTFLYNGLTTMVIPANTYRDITTSAVGSIISISDKYALNIFTSPLNNFKQQFEFNLEDLRYSTSIISLTLSLNNVVGNIQSLENLTGIITLKLARTNVFGDIVSLSKLVNMTSLDLNTTDTHGSVELLCSGLIANGKISGTLKLTAVPTSITYIGDILEVQPLNIVFDSTGCTVSGTGVTSRRYTTLTDSWADVI